MLSFKPNPSQLKNHKNSDKRYKNSISSLDVPDSEEQWFDLWLFVSSSCASNMVW